MNPQTLLAGLPWAGEDLLLSGGAVLLVGIALVHFWKEVLVGVVAVWLIAHYFGGTEVPLENQVPAQASPEPESEAAPEAYPVIVPDTPRQGILEAAQKTVPNTVREAKLKEPARVIGLNKSDYFEDCVSLTQNREVCAEVSEKLNF
jgi:hypothetical protein